MKIYSVAVIFLYKNDENTLKFTISCPVRDELTVYLRTLKLFFTNVKTMKHFIKRRSEIYFIKKLLRQILQG